MKARTPFRPRPSRAGHAQPNAPAARWRRARAAAVLSGVVLPVLCLSVPGPASAQAAGSGVRAVCDRDHRGRARARRP